MTHKLQVHDHFISARWYVADSRLHNLIVGEQMMDMILLENFSDIFRVYRQQRISVQKPIHRN